MEETRSERWEPLAEAHFAFDGDITDENYIYCLCSRVYIRNGVKYYSAEVGGSESDGERGPTDSHVHFSQDTTYRQTDEKEDVASCYCSASHTDNNYSTDEHDTNAPRSRPLQTSDSGADLTYQDGHSDSHNLSQSAPNTPGYDFITDINMDDNNDIKPISDYAEDYLSHDTWEKYWQENGERLIWASWISQYSDYINPSYLEPNDIQENDQHVNNLDTNEKKMEMRERKFSYDSKVNPYKKSKGHKLCATGYSTDDEWLPVVRQRSCSEHVRLLSPRTVAADSMTNVTKLTMSSYDVNSSHVTSESSRSDDYSVSSSPSTDPSNEHTRVYVDGENTNAQSEMDAEEYWQFLWKKHFGEQYALHYANYIESHTAAQNVDVPFINIETISGQEDKPQQLADIECENSDGNSQEMPSVVEVQKQVTQIKIGDEKPKKRNRKSTNYLSSVGVLLQGLLNDEKSKSEAVDGGDEQCKTDAPDMNRGSEKAKVQGRVTSKSFISDQLGGNDEDGDPPEDRPINLKRSHESDADSPDCEKIRSTFTQIGLSWEPGSAKGQLVYRKKHYQLRTPRVRKAYARKTYFDGDGRPYTVEKPSNSAIDDSKEMQTDDDCSQVKSDDELPESEPWPSQTDAGVPELTDKLETDTQCDVAELPNNSDTVKRKRRKHRKSANPATQLPSELADDPKLVKYWNKRHSLFHRFDEGIRLDKQSWFSVTPEKVAKHLAERCRCDLIVDAFCGAGGNAIQFAWTCERVIAIDIDPVKIELARHNATVYGLSDRIEFIVGDFFQLAPSLSADVVFLSPPWGGPTYSKERSYDLESMLEPVAVSRLMAAALRVAGNVALYVPRNSRTDQLVEQAKTSGAVEIEQNFLGRRLIALTAYYGDLVNC